MSIGTIIFVALAVGLPYLPACLGVWMTYPLQDTFDLSVNGTFVVGGGVYAAWVSSGHGALTGMLLATLAGVVCGIITTTVVAHLKLGLILSGIIVGIGLYSVALWIMGQPDINVVGKSNAVTAWTDAIFPGNTTAGQVTFFLAVGLALSALLYLFLKSEYGLVLRANATSKQMVLSNGKSPQRMLYTAVIIGNALTAFSASLVVQQQGFSDIQMGLNTILLGVTAVLIGEMILGRRRIGQRIIGVMVGIVVYYLILTEVLNLGLNPSWFQGVTAAAVIILVGIRLIGGRIADRLGESRQAHPSGLPHVGSPNGATDD